MFVEARRSRFRSRIKWRIVRTYSLPVVGALIEGFAIELRVTWGVAQRCHGGVEIGLAGTATHGGHGGIGDVHAGLGGLEYGSRVQAAGVVSVKMDGDANLLAQSANQRIGGIRLAQPGHVF